MNVTHVDDGSARATQPLRGALGVVARRPSLWWPALCGAVRFAPRGWWRHPPFLPVPDARYWRFRMETAFGDDGASPTDDDVSDALRWSRRARVRRR